VGALLALLIAFNVGKELHPGQTLKMVVLRPEYSLIALSCRINDAVGWYNGFVEGMAYHREDWKPSLTTEAGFLALAPILMTSDPDEWDEKDVLNPFTELTPLELGDALKLGTLAVHKFWCDFEGSPSPIKAAETPGRNDPCPCGSSKKYKRCCGRQA
jgi:uncharacterized protein YecA (UPF0149 family)